MVLYALGFLITFSLVRKVVVFLELFLIQCIYKEKHIVPGNINLKNRNDIVTDIQTNILLFADDTTLFVMVEDPQQAHPP